MSELPDPIAVAANVTNPEGLKPPVRAKLFMKAAGVLLSLSGCNIDEVSTEPVGPEEPTQGQVWSLEAGGISGGFEGDGNGLFNTREPVTPEDGEYKKDGILDAIPGLPNVVFGTSDDASKRADGAPLGDGTYFTTDEGEDRKGTEEKATIDLTVRVPTLETSRKTVEKTVAGEEPADTQYERDFETDQKTFEQASVGAQQVADETLALIEDGYTVTSVKITGKASGEDHTKGGPMANIGEPSENNLDLAGQRAGHGQAALDKAFAERSIDTSGAALELNAIEAEPTTEQTAELQKAADALGITVNELTERFNTGIGKFSPEATEDLVDALVHNKGVVYEVHASKTADVTELKFKETIIKLPLDVIKKIAGKDAAEDSLFRIEIPGEILLLLLAWQLRKVPLPSLPGGGRSPRTPGPPLGPEPSPLPPPTKIPDPKIPIPVPPGPPNPPPPGPPPPRPSFRLERGTWKASQVDATGPVAHHQKQPRRHNYSPQRSGLHLGGRGTATMHRTKGGNRSGKRG